MPAETPLQKLAHLIAIDEATLSFIIRLWPSLKSPLCAHLLIMGRQHGVYDDHVPDEVLARMGVLAVNSSEHDELLRSACQRYRRTVAHEQPVPDRSLLQGPILRRHHRALATRFQINRHSGVALARGTGLRPQTYVTDHSTTRGSPTKPCSAPCGGSREETGDALSASHLSTCSVGESAGMRSTDWRRSAAGLWVSPVVSVASPAI